MSISKSSKSCFSFDVPEINNFNATFQYNFFVPDESVSDVVSYSSDITKNNSYDAISYQVSSKKLPRFVKFSFDIPKTFFDETQFKNISISNNLDKIISEDFISSNGFTGINFQSAELDNKLYYLISGSYLLRDLSNNASNSDKSHFRASSVLNNLTPSFIKKSFIENSITNPKLSVGLRFFDSTGSEIVQNSLYDKLKNVSFGVQINNKIINDLLERSLLDINSTFDDEIINLISASINIQNDAIEKSNGQNNELNEINVPYVDVQTGTNSKISSSDIIGYLIDKSELLSTGEIVNHKPIIIENPRINSAIDTSIKYNSTYIYVIRTISAFTIPIYNKDHREISHLTVLVSSKPSNSVYVKTVESIAPPPPVDIGFVINYDRINPNTAELDSLSGEPLTNTGKKGSLMIHWSFPTNPQRDIKKFQVFRRSNIYHPFELIKVYDFDDSVIKFDDQENALERLIEKTTTPKTHYYDDEFYFGDVNSGYIRNKNIGALNKADDEPTWSSKYIYAIACIDAHGYTSNLSAQFQVYYDPFSNKLVKKLISHSGAPKHYPNIYLNEDAFIDVIKIGGEFSKKLKIVFNPEYYTITDNNDNQRKTLVTSDIGKYKLQLINTDNQKLASVDIFIDDIRTQILR